MVLRQVIAQVLVLFLCSFSALAATADTVAPELIDMHLSPSVIDVTDGPAQVTLTARVKEANGMGNYNQHLMPPEGYQTNFRETVFICQTCSNTPKWERIDGTDEYEVSVTFELDRDSPAGKWSVIFEYLRDAAGNYMPTLDAEALVALGLDPYVDVINPYEVDTTPPELMSYSLSATEINSSEGAEIIEVHMLARDERAMGNHLVYLRGPSDSYGYQDYIHVCNSCSGDERPKWQPTAVPDVYSLRVQFEIAQDAEAGIWRIEPGYIRDELGNGTDYFNDETLAELGFNARFVVNDTVEISLALNAEEPLNYIEFGSSGDIGLTLSAEEGQTLPSEFQLTLTADAGIRIDEAFVLQNVSNAMSCLGYSSYYRCDVAIAEGLTKVDVLSRVTPQTEGVYEIVYEVASEQDLNWADNQASVSVNAHPQSYLITTEIIGNGGEFSPAELDAPIDQTANFELTTYEGYELIQVSGCGGSLSGTTYTTAPVDGACTVTAEFERLSYTVNFYSNDGSLLKSQRVFYGETAIAPEVPPITGYHFIGWDTEFSHVTQDLSVTAQYAINQYEVSLWITGKGSVNPGAQTINWGETLLFELVPEADYKLYSIEGCGGQLVDEFHYQTAAITQNCEIVVKFRDASPRKSTLLMLLMATQSVEQQ